MTPKPGKNWGTEIIPRDKWVSPDKHYRTRSGRRVCNIHIVLTNSTGAEVTFPVKGTIVLKEKPWKATYGIWTLDGRASVMKDATPLDLIEVGKPRG